MIEKTGLAEAQVRDASDTHARLTRKVESLEHRINRMRTKVWRNLKKFYFFEIEIFDSTFFPFENDEL